MHVKTIQNTYHCSYTLFLWEFQGGTADDDFENFQGHLQDYVSGNLQWRTHLFQEIRIMQRSSTFVRNRAMKWDTQTLKVMKRYRSHLGCQDTTSDVHKYIYIGKYK